MPTVIPAMRVNANDIRRGSGGTALRWLRISNANDAQISTTDAYARAMECTSTQFWGRLLYVSVARPSRRTPSPNTALGEAVTYNRRPRR
jgi:hypothetical protein